MAGAFAGNGRLCPDGTRFRKSAFGLLSKVCPLGRERKEPQHDHLCSAEPIRSSRITAIHAIHVDAARQTRGKPERLR